MEIPHRTPSLLELAEQITAAASSITQHLRSKSLAEPTFHPPSAGLPNDPEIEEARKNLLIASRALSVLSHDPLSHLRETILQFNESCALGVICDWGIATILNLDGTPMHISELSQKSGADEYKLAAVMRLLTCHYIFCEVKPGYFAHNSSSIYLANRQTACLVGHCLDSLVQGSLKVSEAMRKWPNSTKPNETGFCLGNNTEKPLFPWLTDHPEKMERFNECLKVMAQSSYHRLRTVYPWKALGKATVVDIGGGNGHISYEIAREAPDLDFIIQDLPQTVGEASKDCPEDLRPRFDFQAVDFFEPQKVQADAYFMRMILHFMDDDDCIRVIKNIIPAMKKDSRILVAEGIIPQCEFMPNPHHRYVFNQNWNMITVMNARERTFEDFLKLFKGADKRFRVKQWGEAGGSAPSSEILEATLEINDVDDG